MKLDTIGKNIRKFRLARKLRQEDLAEKTDLTTNYIGMVAVSYTHLRAHETDSYLVCRLLLEKKKTRKKKK